MADQVQAVPIEDLLLKAEEIPDLFPAHVRTTMLQARMEITRLRASLAAAEAERESLWQLIPPGDRVKVCEGGGPENRDASMGASIARLIYTRDAAEARAVKAEGELDQSRTAWRAMKERWIEAGEERDAAIAQVGEEARKRGLVEAERDAAVARVEGLAEALREGPTEPPYSGLEGEWRRGLYCASTPPAPTLGERLGYKDWTEAMLLNVGADPPPERVDLALRLAALVERDWNIWKRLRDGTWHAVHRSHPLIVQDTLPEAITAAEAEEAK